MITVCDYSYDGVRRSLDASLERMRVEHVDILLIHDPELHYRQAVRGAYRALDEMRRDGTIGAIGVAMNQTGKLRRMADDGDFDAFLLAGRYSLLDQSAATDLFPVTSVREIAVILAGVFNSGILADPRPGTTFDYRPASSAQLAKAQRLAAVCERHDVPLKAAALTFSFSHPAVHTMLLGSTSAVELDESVELLQTPVPPDLWVDLRRSRLLRDDVPVPAPSAAPTSSLSMSRGDHGQV
jgi:D-threo-aldose 1-dehydrogenase